MGLLSLLSAPAPKTIDQLDMECSSIISRGDFQKAARIAHAFRNYAINARHFDDKEKVGRVANAYYWLCKATFKQVEGANKSGLYGLLVAFFAAHKLGIFYIQKAISTDALCTLDKKHPLYPRHQELNRMYDLVYKSKPRDVVGKADLDANEQVRL